MEKINAYAGRINWNKSIYEPKLVIHFRRNEDNYENWYEIHIKLTPDIVADISKELKSYMIGWWDSKVDTFNRIKEVLKF